MVSAGGEGYEWRHRASGPVSSCRGGPVPGALLMQHAGTAMPYQPIEIYGVTGNLRTAALVGVGGPADWLRQPDIDSPSVFAAILDDGKDGRFCIAPPHDGVRHKQ